MKTKRIKAIMCVMAVFALVGISNADWYTYSYEGNVLPTAATPAWTEKYLANTYSSVVGGEYLHIDSSSSQALRPYYTYTGGAGTDWDLTSSTALTLEMKAQVVSNTGFSGAFCWLFGTGIEGVPMTFRTDSITWGTTQVITLDATQWHVYHVTATQAAGDWTWTLTIDNNSQSWEYAGSTSTTYKGNQLLFGDTSGTGTTMGGVENIEYIRWNPTQAIPINVPEPATMALLSCGLAFVVVRRSKHRA